MKILLPFKYTLKDWRIWIGLLFSLVVALMMSYTDLTIKLDGGNSLAVLDYFMLSFSRNLAMSLYILTAASTVVTDFSQDYHQNRLPFLLSRMSLRQYASSFVKRLIFRSYFVGLTLGFCFLVLLSFYFPLTNSYYSSTFSNQWLLNQGFIFLFYFLLISLIGLYFAFFTLLGGVLSVFYPNILMVYLLPSMTWFVLTKFGLERVLPFFTLPHIVLTTDDYLREGLEYFKVGDENFRNIFSLLYPYIFLILWALLSIEIIRLALKKHWHFYDKE